MALFVLCSGVILAQPSVSISPSYGATNVPLHPTIIITSTLSIDSSSITWGNFGDPITHPDTASQTIRLIPDEVMSWPDSVWNLSQITGTYQLLNPHTLVFTPLLDLHWATKYRVTVKGLKVFNMTGASVLASEESVVFTTVQRPHHLLMSSIHNGDAVCPHDTFSFDFNRPVANLTTSMGSLLVMEHIVVDSSHAYGDSAEPFSANFWLSSDSLHIYGAPFGALVPGQPYRVRVNVSYLSGNSADDRAIGLYCRERYGVTYSVATVDTTDSISGPVNPFPNIGANYYAQGDTVKLRAGWKEGYSFVRWQSSDIPSIDNSVVDTATFVLCCKDVAVTALYSRIPFDSLGVDAADSGGTVVVYSKNLDSLGGTATYPVRQGDSLWVVALPDTNHTFDKWTSSVTALNGSTDQIIAFPATGAVQWIKPVFKFKVPLIFTYCGSAGGAEAAAATVSPSCHVTTTSQGRSISAAISNPTTTNKGKRIMYRIDPNGSRADFSPSGITADSYTYSTQQWGPATKWLVQKVQWTLSVSKLLDNGNPAPPEAKVDVSPNKPLYDDGEVVTLTASDDPANGVTFDHWEPGNSTSKTIQVTMDANKSYVAVFTEDFRIKTFGWYTDNAIQPTDYAPNALVRGVRVLPMSPKPSTWLVVKFSRPVNASSVTDQNFYVQELIRRIDGQALQTYTAGNVTISQWTDDKTLVLKLHRASTDLSVVKLQTLLVVASDGIKSQSGTSLHMPGGLHTQTHIAQTENPDVRVKISKVTVTYDQDPGACGEIFGGWVGVRQRPSGQNETWKNDMPGNNSTESICAPPNTDATFTSGQQFLATKIGDNDAIGVGVDIMDQDGGEAVNNILKAVSTVANAAANLPGSLISPLSTFHIAAQVIGAISGAAAQSGLFGDNDDQVTNADWVYGEADLWGILASPGDLYVWHNTGAIGITITLE